MLWDRIGLGRWSGWRNRIESLKIDSVLVSYANLIFDRDGLSTLGKS